MKYFISQIDRLQSELHLLEQAKTRFSSKEVQLDINKLQEQHKLLTEEISDKSKAKDQRRKSTAQLRQDLVTSRRDLQAKEKEVSVLKKDVMEKKRNLLEVQKKLAILNEKMESLCGYRYDLLQCALMENVAVGILEDVVDVAEETGAEGGDGEGGGGVEASPSGSLSERLLPRDEDAAPKKKKPLFAMKKAGKKKNDKSAQSAAVTKKNAKAGKSKDGDDDGDDDLDAGMGSKAVVAASPAGSPKAPLTKKEKLQRLEQA